MCLCFSPCFSLFWWFSVSCPVFMSCVPVHCCLSIGFHTCFTLVTCNVHLFPCPVLPVWFLFSQFWISYLTTSAWLFQISRHFSSDFFSPVWTNHLVFDTCLYFGLRSCTASFIKTQAIGFIFQLQLQLFNSKVCF